MRHENSHYRRSTFFSLVILHIYNPVFQTLFVSIQNESIVAWHQNFSVKNVCITCVTLSFKLSCRKLRKCVRCSVQSRYWNELIPPGEHMICASMQRRTQQCMKQAHAYIYLCVGLVQKLVLFFLFFSFFSIICQNFKFIFLSMTVMSKRAYHGLSILS